MSPLIINLFGLICILAIIYWFWLYRPKAVPSREGSVVEIIVEGGIYSPSVIEATFQQPLCLRFIRKDPSPCAEWVIFDTLGISRSLPMEHPETIELEKIQKGTYEFTCQMGMYRGTLIVS